MILPFDIGIFFIFRTEIEINNEIVCHFFSLMEKTMIFVVVVFHTSVGVYLDLRKQFINKTTMNIHSFIEL